MHNRTTSTPLALLLVFAILATTILSVIPFTKSVSADVSWLTGWGERNAINITENGGGAYGTNNSDPVDYTIMLDTYYNTPPFESDGLFLSLLKPAYYYEGNYKRTYMSFYTMADESINIKYFDEDSKELSDVVTVKSGVGSGDAHMNPSVIVLENQGNVSHNGKLLIVLPARSGADNFATKRSARQGSDPYDPDLSSWDNEVDITVAGSQYCNYPVLREVSDGTILLFYRKLTGDTSPDVAMWYYQTSTDAGESWGNETLLTNFDALEDEGCNVLNNYVVMNFKGDEIHFACFAMYIISDGDDPDYVYDSYPLDVWYWKTEDATASPIVWKVASSETPITLPVDEANADLVYETSFDSGNAITGHDEITFAFDIVVDGSSNPTIISTGANVAGGTPILGRSENTYVRHHYYDSGWQTSVVTNGTSTGGAGVIGYFGTTPKQIYFSGGVSDHNDPNIIYIGVKDSANMSQMQAWEKVSGTWYIADGNNGTTAICDDGKITQNSIGDHFWPYFVTNAPATNLFQLLWAYSENFYSVTYAESMLFCYPGFNSQHYIGFNKNSRTDFGDVRFTQDDEVTLQPSASDGKPWIQEKTDSWRAVLWLQVGSIPASGGSLPIYAYYNNPTATNDMTTQATQDANFYLADMFSSNVDYGYDTSNTTALLGDLTHNTGSGTANYFVLEKYQASATGILTHIVVQSAASGNIKAGMYSDNAGSPDTLIAEQVVPFACSIGTNYIPVQGFPTLSSGTDYWIAWNMDTNGVTYYGDLATGTTKYKVSTYSTFSFPTTPGGGFTDSTRGNSVAGYRVTAEYPKWVSIVKEISAASGNLEANAQSKIIVSNLQNYPDLTQYQTEVRGQFISSHNTPYQAWFGFTSEVHPDHAASLYFPNVANKVSCFAEKAGTSQHNEVTLRNLTSNHIWTVQRHNSSLIRYHSDVVKQTTTGVGATTVYGSKTTRLLELEATQNSSTYVPTVNMPVLITSSSQASRDMDYDWIFVRPITNPEPLISASPVGEEQAPVPTVITNSATSVEDTNAILNGNVTATGNGNVSCRGFAWDTSTHTEPSIFTSPATSDYTTGNWTECSGYPAGAFTYNATLTEGELYYYRAASNTSLGWGWGNESVFLTLPDEPTGLTNTSQDETWIALSWSTGNGSDNTMIRYKLGSYPTDETDGVQGYFNSGSTANITSLNCSTSYYFRGWSYATEGGLEEYSDSYTQLQANTTICILVPTVVTNNATLIEETTVTLNGNLTATGNENNDEQGFYYDIDSGTPYANNQTSLGSFGVGTFNENITGLTEGELYYFQAISHNSKGWGNGSELTFLTKPDEPTALLNTSRTSTSIVMAWTVADGADRYIVTYNTSGYPTNYSDGTIACNTSSTTCTATPLSSGQIYYIRVWSWCTEGGLQQWSDTYDEITRYTNPADITSFDAFNPSASTIDLSWIKGAGGDKTHIRGQQGSYPANVSSGTQIYFDTGITTTHSGLGSGETWYYRAWAYDSNSGYYSDSYDQDFDTTTAVGSPTVVTIAATLVEETTASITGNVTVINDTNIIERGFQYDLDSAPPYTWNWTQNGTYGLGTFTYNLTSLTQGELYYYRAFAENDNPTYGYGSELKFLTKPEAPSGLTSINTTTTSISLSWTTGNGSDNTMIRYATGSYPATYNDGTQGYFGSSNTTTISALDPGITYYLRAWSYATEDGEEQYSDSYSEVTVATSGVASGIDLDVRGNLRMLGLVLLPIGLMAIGFWQRKQWVMMMAGISFIGLGAYGIVDADGTWGSSMIVGAASFIFATAVLIYATMRMKEAPESDVDVPLDTSYEQELREERKQREQERKERRGDLL